MGVGAARLPISLVSHDLADGALVHWGRCGRTRYCAWDALSLAAASERSRIRLSRPSQGSLSHGGA
jgi:hypothetical protein